MSYILENKLDYLKFNDPQLTKPLVRLLNPLQVSIRLGVSTALLWKWRKLGIGPPFVQPQKGGRILYDKEKIDQWLEDESNKNLQLHT